MPGRNTEKKDRLLLEIVVVFRGPWKKAFLLITQFKICQSIINAVLPALTSWRRFSLTRVICE